jgi:two-component system, cell cycle response regulator
VGDVGTRSKPPIALTRMSPTDAARESAPKDLQSASRLMPAKRLSRRARILLRAAQMLAFAGIGLELAHTAFGLGKPGLDAFFDNWVYNGLIVIAAVFCLTRAAVVRSERGAWLGLGVALALWSGGEIYYSAVLAHQAEPPYPSLSDALYLAFYPASYLGLYMLVRGRVRQAPLSLGLDGMIAALAVAALAAAIVLPPVLQSTGASGAAAATTLAYPLGDALLLALCVALFTLTGWKPGRAWAFIGVGLGLAAVADSVFLYQSARGTYVEGTLLDAMWPMAALILGYAAWSPSLGAVQVSLGRWSLLVVPSLASLTAIALLTYDHHTRIEAAAVGLAAATLVTAVARLAISFSENVRMLALSRQHALTDPLTGLPNRRKLLADLKERIDHADPHAPQLLVLFDMNGFKRYNDTYGHLAGDALLARLGASFAAAVEPNGTAYRLGGDEFCLLTKLGALGVDATIVGATAALSERGGGFTVTASHGSVIIPHEARDSTVALQLADERLYAQKGSRQGVSTGHQIGGVLLQALHESEPRLSHHMREVAALSHAVGRRLNLSNEALDELMRAAELHDIGKMAIPDAVWNQPGPLGERDLELVRQHTIVAERILNVAPPMRGVARLVRASHERWDGKGYPDGLAGEEIPLGARIISVCDAFEAMIADRCYRAPVEVPEALAELRHCAGTQFDPKVVEAFCEELTARFSGVQPTDLTEETTTPEPVADESRLPALGRS